MELAQIQKEILNWCLKYNFQMLKDNIFTKNKKESYNEGDETWKIYNGILPPRECIANLDLTTNLLDTPTITRLSSFKNKMSYDDLTPEFLLNFKQQYENFIRFFYDNIVIIDSSKIETRTDDELHDGTKNTIRHGNGIDFYLFKGFNYDKDLSIDEKEQYCKILKSYNSLFEKRNELYESINSKLKTTENLELQFKYNEVLKNKKKEEESNSWIIINKEQKLNPLTGKNQIIYWDTVREMNYLINAYEDKIANFSIGSKYNKGTELFRKRREQLINLKTKLESGIKCHDIDEKFINDEIEKLNILDDTTESNENKSVKICNTVQWGKIEEDPMYQKKIEGTIEERCHILNNRPHLYQFVDFDTKDNPPDSLPLEKRQVIYGNKNDLSFFKNYRQYYRCSPNFFNHTSKNCITEYDNLVYYSLLLNKLETFCATELKILFPLRFVIKNPFNPNIKSLLNRYPKLIESQSLLRYKLIGMIHIKRIKSNSSDVVGLYILIFKNNEKDFKSEYQFMHGNYNYFAFIDIGNTQVQDGFLFSIQNITWDEIKLTYKYLLDRKDVYYYKKDEEDNNQILNIFIHNKKHGSIPLELLNQLCVFDDKTFEKLDTNFKEYYTNRDKTMILNSYDVGKLFPFGIDAEKWIRKQPSIPNWGSFNKKKSSTPNLRPFNRRFGGSLKIFKPDYISNYKPRLNILYTIYLDDFKNTIISIDRRSFQMLFNNYNFALIFSKYKNSIDFKIDNNLFIRNFELIYNYNLINKNNMDILEINNYTNQSLYNCNFIANKKKILLNYDLDLFNIYLHTGLKNLTNKNQEYNFINHTNIYNNYITKDLLLNKINKKYDLIFCNLTLFRMDFGIYQEEQNLNLKFIFILYSLLRLNKNSDLIISYGDISTIQSYQIINNLIPYFNEIIIFNSETVDKYKLTGITVICKKFKDNFNINTFMILIDEIFNLDKTLGNNFDDINDNYNVYDKKIINIYLDNYSVNRKYDKKLLKDINIINEKKHFFIIRSFYNFINTLNLYKDSDNLIDNIIKMNDDLRLVCTYMKALELDIIDKKENTQELQNNIKSTVKKLKENTIITKNIAIYKKMSKTDSNPELNLEKLKMIQEFSLIIKEKRKKNNIFDIINFDKYKQTIYDLLEKSRHLYLSYNSDDLYNIDIIHKLGDKYTLTDENKTCIDSILILYFNEVIENIYEKQEIKYYLDMYKL